MTFVLQLHFVKMKLNLKQKKSKKAVLRFDYLLYFFFLLPPIGLQYHLNYICRSMMFPSPQYNNLTVTVANCYYSFRIFSFV